MLEYPTNWCCADAATWEDLGAHSGWGLSATVPQDCLSLPQSTKAEAPGLPDDTFWTPKDRTKLAFGLVTASGKVMINKTFGWENIIHRISC